MEQAARWAGPRRPRWPSGLTEAVLRWLLARGRWRGRCGLGRRVGRVHALGGGAAPVGSLALVVDVRDAGLDRTIGLDVGGVVVGRPVVDLDRGVRGRATVVRLDEREHLVTLFLRPADQRLVLAVLSGKL